MKFFSPYIHQWFPSKRIIPNKPKKEQRIVTTDLIEFGREELAKQQQERLEAVRKQRQEYNNLLTLPVPETKISVFFHATAPRRW